MSKRTNTGLKMKHDAKECLHLLHDLRLKVAEVNTKLDHLIKNYRRLYFVSDGSPSSQREFDD